MNKPPKPAPTRTNPPSPRPPRIDPPRTRPPPRPPTPKPPPFDHGEVARQQARLEQQMMEAKLEILRSHRQQRESAVNRRFTLGLVFVLAGGVAYVLDHRGYSAATSVLGCVLTVVVVGAWWAYRSPYGS